MSRIEDMLRDPANRPRVAPCGALADRVVASIEGEPDEPPARAPMAGALAMVAIAGVGVTVTLWPPVPASRGFERDPRARLEESIRGLAERPVPTSVVREARLLKGDAEAVLQPFKAKLSRM